jgi:hypothetical protein
MLQVRLETEEFRVQREDLRLAMDKLRGEGTDMKLEIQSLKKVEKLIKVITLLTSTEFSPLLVS